MDHRIQIHMIGDAGVGKSSIVHRYCDKMFSASYDTTEGLDVYPIFFLHYTENVKMDLWDFSGSPSNREAWKKSHKMAQGIFIVYDATRRSTFDLAVATHQEILKTVGGKSNCPIIILISNKCDLPGVFPNQEARRYAIDHEINYIETSAREGTNITHAFDDMIEEVMLKKYIRDNEDSVKSQLKAYESMMTPVFCRCCPEKFRPSVPGAKRPRRVVIYRRKTFEGRDLMQHPQDQTMNR